MTCRNLQPSRKWCKFQHVVQKCTKFANLYFPHFTTFCDQHFPHFTTFYKFKDALSSRCNDGFRSSNQNLVYIWNHPLVEYCRKTIVTSSLLFLLVRANVPCLAPDQTTSNVARMANVLVRKTWLVKTATDVWMVILLWKLITRMAVDNASVTDTLQIVSRLVDILVSISLPCSVLVPRNGVL